MANVSSNWENCLQYAAVSDVGMRRANNQDSHIELVADDPKTWRERGHLFVVADGMGAHAAGELASKLAVEGVTHHYHKHRELSPPEAILKAVRDTNAEIHRRGQANTEFHNMGTTCSSLLLLPQGALLAHVGDSRVYRYRQDKVQQLTFDHSLVWEMRAAGQLGQADEPCGIPKNVITRSLGPHPNVQIDLEGPLPIAIDDTYLLCSDGLTARVEDAEIGLCLSLLPAHEAAEMLVRMANARGGPDNTTVIVVKVTGTDVTTRAARAEPLTVGSELRPRRNIPVAVWITLGVSVVVGGGLAATGHLLPGLISCAMGIGAVCVSALFNLTRQNGTPLVGGRRLGRGPYVTVECGSPELVEQKLFASVEQLVASGAVTLSVDEASRLDNCLQEARIKTKRNEHADALRLCDVALGILVDASQAYRQQIDL